MNSQAAHPRSQFSLTTIFFYVTLAACLFAAAGSIPDFWLNAGISLLFIALMLSAMTYILAPIFALVFLLLWRFQPAHRDFWWQRARNSGIAFAVNAGFWLCVGLASKIGLLG